MRYLFSSFKDGVDEFSRKRRVPYMLYPSMGGGFGRSSIDEEYEDDDDGEMRKK